MNETTFTRKELYKLVWSTPLTTIAKKYLISDVGLKKRCIAMDIPLPRAGHWEKIRAGKPVHTVPLPVKYTGKGETSLRLRTQDDPSPSQKDPVRALIKAFREQNISFPVPDTFSDPRILKVQKRLAGKDPNLKNGLVGAGRDYLTIDVSPGNIHRTLCFMQGLISALEKRGHQLAVKSGETVVVVYGQSMEIALREKVKMKLLPNSWGVQRAVYEPGGSLILKLGRYGTKEWQDNARKLEEQLSDIIARIEVEAQLSNERAIQAEKEREIKREQERLRAIFEQKKQQELDHFKALLTDAAHWQMTAQLRAYLDEVEKQAENKNELTAELKQWLVWARQKADWLDPLIHAQDEWLSEEDRQELFEQEEATEYPLSSPARKHGPYFPRPWYTRR